MSRKTRIGLLAVVIVAAAGIALLLAGPKPANDASHFATEAPAAGTLAPAVDSAAADVVAPADVAPPEMMEMKSALEAEYAERRDEIPEEVAKPIDDDIGVIEGIAADLLAALANEPDNDDLKRMLVQTYRNEMKLLKKALHLSSGDDEEIVEPEAEAAPTN